MEIQEKWQTLKEVESPNGKAPEFEFFEETQKRDFVPGTPRFREFSDKLSGLHQGF